MRAYYNELDPFAAAWLRELIKEGLIADGEVDERSIADVRAEDVRGFTQCHFFAGIGGWSYALRLAAWPDARPVWTGSCPCQPFSAAGANLGGTDPRHLWPAWYRLIRECRPSVVFGEQVESAIAHGWLDLVCDDLEAEGYACGAVGLPAASVGAPHIRQRLWFVADAEQSRERYESGGMGAAQSETKSRESEPWREAEDVIDNRATRLVAESNGGHARAEGLQRSREHGLRAEGRYADGPAGDAERPEVRRCAECEDYNVCHGLIGGCAREMLRLAESESAQLDRSGHTRRGRGEPTDGGDAGELADAEGSDGRLLLQQRRSRQTSAEFERGSEVDAWGDLQWLPCRDGKARPTQSGLFPLAHGVSNRVGTLCGAGNAICPQVAQAFIEAYLDTEADGNQMTTQFSGVNRGSEAP